MSGPLVRNVQYVRLVQNLAEVWETVMAVVDEFEHPDIHVKPVAVMDMDDEGGQPIDPEMVSGFEVEGFEGNWVHRYQVQVSGTAATVSPAPVQPRRAFPEGR